MAEALGGDILKRLVVALVSGGQLNVVTEWPGKHHVAPDDLFPLMVLDHMIDNCPY